MTRRYLTGARLLSGLVGLTATILGVGCSRCDRSQRQRESETAPPPVPSQLLAKAGRLGPILAHNSVDCLACAETRCQAKVDQCLNIQGLAAAGPAEGRSKTELCSETLDCAIKSRCVMGGGGKNCYCGSAKGMDCISPKANGACKSKIESGLETTNPSEIATKFVDDQRGGGAAMMLVLCLATNRCDRCF